MASRKGHNSTSAGSSRDAEPTPSAVLDVALERLVQCLTPTPKAWSQRQSWVNEHVRRLQQHWHTNHQIRISPFGSSLSGLCLADSDIDLGLFGVMHGVSLEAITSGQAKKLLYSILSGLHRAHLVQGKVQTVMGARVPVLKYTCALSGLDVDVSIQGTGALVKANFMALLNQHCPALSPLYRLVKLWAAAHDINDASRSTFNSTSLLYLTTFFLQTRQLVPPLQELVDPALLNDPAQRLLCELNRWLWDRPEHLNELLGAARLRVQAWVRVQQQQRGKAWSQQSLGELLHGFFTFYADLFTDWVTGKRRGVYVDLWAGQLSSCRPTHEQLGRDYLINLQDPFDPTDCPARAIGSSRVDNGGMSFLVTYLMTCSSTAMVRFLQPDSSSDGSSSSSSSGGLQGGLCQCLAWLFGPPGVLHLCPNVAGALSSAASLAALNGVSSAVATVSVREGGGNSSHAHSQQHWHAWAASPFEVELVAALLQRRQQQQQAQQQQGGSSHGRGRRGQPETPAALFRWLVSSLQAAVEPEHGPCVLCPAHLSLLNSRIEARTLSGTLGARLAAEAASRKAQKHQQQQQLEEWRQQCQQQLLPGPPLPNPDEQLLQVYTKLANILQSQRWKPRPDGTRKDPASHPRSVKEAARDAVTQVALCMQALAAAGTPHSHPQQQQHEHHQEQGVTHHHHHHRHHHHHGGGQDPHMLAADVQPDPQQDGWEDAAAAAAGALQEGDSCMQEDLTAAADGGGEAVAEGIGGYGLLAVLEQHGFLQLFEEWHFTGDDGQIWQKLLPLPEHLKQRKQHKQQQQERPAVVSGSNAGNGAADGVGAATAAVFDGVGGHAAPRDGMQQLGGAASSSSRGREAQAAPEPAAPAEASRGSQVGAAGISMLRPKTQAALKRLIGNGSRELEAQGSSSAPGAAGSGSGGQDAHASIRSTAASNASREFLQLFDKWHFPANQAAASGSGQQQHSQHPQSQQQTGQPVQHAQQQQQHQQQQHAQQQQRGGRQPPGGSGGSRRRGNRSPTVAVPIDMEPADAGPMANRCDGLAERYCRQLQEQLSLSPPPNNQAVQQALPQQQHQQQWGQQRHEPAAGVPYPAAALLGGPSTGGRGGESSQASNSSTRMAAAPSPAPSAAGAHGAAGGRAAASVPKPKAKTEKKTAAQRKLQQAAYKVTQLEQMINKAAAQIVSRREEEEWAHNTIVRLMTAAGKEGEFALSHDDRQLLLKAKNTTQSARNALKAQHTNLEQAQQKLVQALLDKAAAEAAVAVAGDGGAPSTSASATAAAAAQARWR